jgi:serine/threonine protein phosphatase 1
MKHYAIGDIHGRFDLLNSALSVIGDLEAQDARLVFLGDYVDRGPDSRPVIETLMALTTSDRVICLRGNHEEMMLTAIITGNMAHWLDNGGRATGISYEMAYPALTLAFPREHLKWLAGLPVFYETPWHFYVHGGVRPGVPLSEQDPIEMMWIRDVFLHDDRDHGKHIVHGHTPRQAPELMPNRTNLDTYAYATGNLTIGVFEGPGGPREIWTAQSDGVWKPSGFYPNP